MLLNNTELVPAEQHHFRELAGWFNNATETAQWGGPEMRFPLAADTLIADVNWPTLASYVLQPVSKGRHLNKTESMLGFGQFYARLNRCHLGRLAIHPMHRGQGLAHQLIALLLKQGMNALGLSEASLFVLADNTAARACYQRFGFEEMQYPELLPLASCRYMVLRP